MSQRFARHLRNLDATYLARLASHQVSRMHDVGRWLFSLPYFQAPLKCATVVVLQD